MPVSITRSHSQEAERIISEANWDSYYNKLKTSLSTRRQTNRSLINNLHKENLTEKTRAIRKASLDKEREGLKCILDLIQKMDTNCDSDTRSDLYKTLKLIGNFTKAWIEESTLDDQVCEIKQNTTLYHMYMLMQNAYNYSVKSKFYASVFGTTILLAGGLSFPIYPILAVVAGTAGGFPALIPAIILCITIICLSIFLYKLSNDAYNVKDSLGIHNMLEVVYKNNYDLIERGEFTGVSQNPYGFHNQASANRQPGGYRTEEFYQSLYSTS